MSECMNARQAFYRRRCASAMRARPVAHLAILGVSRVYLRAGTCPERTDCLAGHVRFELRNVVANYAFEKSRRFAGNQRILATETIRVQAATVGGAARAQCQDLGRMLPLAGIAARFSADPFPLAGVRCIAAFGE